MKRENESLLRELDRFDSLYRKLFTEYLDALTENKKLLDGQTSLEKRLAGHSNYINNATIQYINGDSLFSTGTHASLLPPQPAINLLDNIPPMKPLTATSLTARQRYKDRAMTALVDNPGLLALDSKAFGKGHMWRRKQMNQTTTGGSLSCAKGL
jgi:hypothetical protein